MRPDWPDNIISSGITYRVYIMPSTQISLRFFRSGNDTPLSSIGRPFVASETAFSIRSLISVLVSDPIDQ